MITCNFSLSGIKELKISYQSFNLGDIIFPIIPKINTLSGKVQLSDNTSTKVISIAGKQYKYIDLTGNFTNFTEELVEDEKGRYFSSTLNISAVLNENLNILLAHKHVVVFITDNNNNKWIIGYQNPMKLINYSYNSGIDKDGADKYSIVYNNITYSKIKQYEVV